MKTYTAVIERCPDTGLYVGYIPGFPGAHSQAATLDELNANLKEVSSICRARTALHVWSRNSSESKLSKLHECPASPSSSPARSFPFCNRNQGSTVEPRGGITL